MNFCKVISIPFCMVSKLTVIKFVESRQGNKEIRLCNRWQAADC